MTANDPPQASLYPSLGYLTRRQPPGTGILPGSEWAGDEQLAVAG